MVFQSVVFGLIAAGMVGTASFATAVVARRMNLFQVLFWINVGAVGTFTIYLVFGSDLGQVSLTQWGLLCALSLMGIGAYSAYLNALREGPVAVVAPIVAGEAIVGIILAVLILGERLTTGQLLGAVAAIGGGALASVNLRNIKSGQRLIGRGAMFAAVTMVLFGVTLFVIARLTREIGWFLPLYTFRLLTLSFLTLPLLTPVPVLRRQRPWRRLTVGSVLVVALIGVLENGGFFVFSRGAEIGLISIVTVAASGHPLVPILGGVLIFRERLAPNQIIGVVAVLGGVLLLAIG